jgi:F-type H+-transporting ATPase subunit delta
MREITVALKYARALFEAADEEGSLDRVGEDLAGLGKVDETDPAFLRFLVSPKALTEHKLEFLQVVFAPRVAPMTLRFLELLIDKKRIAILPEIVEVFDRLMEEHRSVLRAQVYTAIALTPEAERRLKSGLDRLTGKNVVLEKRIDPYVLGGVVVHLGNRILDGSLRNGLSILSENLHRAEVN